jgi:hypothetical protein
LPEDLDRVRRLGPPGVVGIGVHGPDDTLAVDHEAGRDGQAPGAVTIALGQVDAELQVATTSEAPAAVISGRADTGGLMPSTSRARDNARNTSC